MRHTFRIWDRRRREMLLPEEQRFCVISSGHVLRMEFAEELGGDQVVRALRLADRERLENPEDYIPGDYGVVDFTDFTFVYEENAVLMAFTGQYDDTLWEELSPQEQERWLIPAGRRPEGWPGREIYEGDVVLLRDNNKREETLAECVWQNSRAGFRYRLISGELAGRYTWMVGPMRGSNITCRVIGNVYEQ